MVHGGGPQIGDLLARLGIESEFRDGLRVTDADTLDVARMVLVGKVNRDIVGVDQHPRSARRRPVGRGRRAHHVGGPRTPSSASSATSSRSTPAILHRLLAEDLIPVVSTIGGSADGQAYNINADTVAGALAAALEAEKVIYLTDVPGLLADVDDPSSLIRTATGGRAAGQGRAPASSPAA